MIPKKLILCLDGIGFSHIHEMWKEGFFRGFHEPTRLISTFPSLTYPSYTSLFNAKPCRGFETRYFDWNQNKIRGGFISHTFGKAPPFYQKLNFNPRNIVNNTLTYLMPRLIAANEMRGLKTALRHNTKDNYLGYFIAADALNHLLHERFIKKYLITIDEFIQPFLIYKSEIYIFADHGNERLACHAVPLQKKLQEAHFQLSKTLKKSNDVVIPAMGAINCAFVFTRSERKKELIEALCTSEGVEFLISKNDPETLHVFSKAKDQSLACAVIRKKNGLYSYTWDSEDILGYESIVNLLQKNSKLGVNHAALDQDWFEYSKDHSYPDALHRLFHAFDHVENKPSFILSFKPGWYYSSKVLNAAAVTLRGTHGSLRKEASCSFLLSNSATFPSTLRAYDILGRIQSL